MQNKKKYRLEPHSKEFYAGKTKALIYKDEDGNKLPYRLLVPPNYDPARQYPFLICFHGAGTTGDDNLNHLSDWTAGWVDDAVQSEHPCIIMMPQCPSGSMEDRWVQTDWRNGSYSFNEVGISVYMKMANSVFDNIIEEMSVDENRIYVMGASMGGYATWNFVIRNSNRIAAAIPICGAGDPAMADRIKDIAIWAFHGDADQTVPPSGSIDMIEAIRKAGGTRAKLTMYENVAHNSHEFPWKDDEVINWMFQQTKSPV